MKKIKFLAPVIFITVFLFSSCTKDLDVTPIDPNVSTANNVFQNQVAYKEALAKIYAGFALTGQAGNGGGNPDLQGIDEGFSNYIRMLWNAQELSTDESIVSWNDATIKDFHYQTWAPNDLFIMGLYSRIYFTVALCNELIRNANTAMGSASGTFLSDLKAYKAEARFVRALAYWHAIDLFGNVPFITEADNAGAFFPKRITRADLFSYVESELKDIAGDNGDLKAPKQNEYGRADKAAGWFVLAKLYLNATVYIGANRNTDALTYINKIINAGYTLDPNYKHLFTADNSTSPEAVFSITFDGTKTQSWGGTTFLVCSAAGPGMPSTGANQWQGYRTIREFVGKFGLTQSSFASNPTYPPNNNAGTDKRGMFYFNANNNWVWDITTVATFSEGIGVYKWSNLNSDGSAPSNAGGNFTNTDFHVFRLGDAYLMYAEAVLRGGGGGDVNTAVGYINQLRQRAYGNSAGNITSSQLTLDFILDERGRELYWEGQRRTDLIRFGKFTGGSYLWQWKGNAINGAATPSYRDLFPIPSSDINANPNLIQNPGY